MELDSEDDIFGEPWPLSPIINEAILDYNDVYNEFWENLVFEDEVTEASATDLSKDDVSQQHNADCNPKQIKYKRSSDDNSSTVPAKVCSDDLNQHLTVPSTSRQVGRGFPSENNLKKFLCETCDKGFSSKPHLKRHRISKHLKSTSTVPTNAQPIESTTTSANESPSEKNLKKLLCETCDKGFSSKFNLKRHRISEHLKSTSTAPTNAQPTDPTTTSANDSPSEKNPKSFTCDICHKEFNCKYNLNRHMKSIHVKPNNLECMHCRRVFCRIDKLKKSHGIM